MTKNARRIINGMSDRELGFQLFCYGFILTLSTLELAYDIYRHFAR